MGYSWFQTPQLRQAVFIAVAMMAWQVASKTARDSLFLASFQPTALPAVVGASAVLSILLSYGSSVLFRRAGPSRTVPGAVLLNAVLHVLQWILAPLWPRQMAFLVYVHIAAFGPVLLTGFWAVSNEVFDSREARRHFGHIAAFGTLGAVVGGLLAERVAFWASSQDILLLMTALQVLGGTLLWRFASSQSAANREPTPSFPEIISGAPYLAGLAAFILLTSMSAASLDYVFKAGAVAQFGRGAALTRFFSLFNAIASGLTFLLQATLTPVWTRRFGPGGTVAALPVSVAGAGVVSALLPGPISIVATRALEQLLRGSLFRSGYELFYTPMPPAEKRAAKPVIDVGADRLGEGLASASIQLMLVLPAGIFTQSVLGVTAALSGLAAWIAVRLDRSYVLVLERGLANQVIEIHPEDVQDPVTRSVVMQTATGGLTQTGPYAVSAPPELLDPVIQRLADLRSGDGKRIRAAIAASGRYEPVIIAQMIDLLAQDAVARVVSEALRGNLNHATGQLVDRLADADGDIRIRRRIPRLLVGSNSPLAWDALLRQLRDFEPEIRFRCGRALAEIAERRSEYRAPQETIFTACERELSYEVFPQRHAHLANLLSLVFPPQSVHLAFRALQTEDPKLRATAVEYLDSILPQPLRTRMAVEFEVPVKPVSGEPRHSV